MGRKMQVLINLSLGCLYTPLSNYLNFMYQIFKIFFIDHWASEVKNEGGGIGIGTE